MQELKSGRRIVSKGAFTATKTLALGLSGSFMFCTLISAGLLLNYAFVQYKFGQLEELCHTRGCSLAQLNAVGEKDIVASWSLLLLMPLLPMAYGGWRGSRKCWQVVRIMEPLTRANTADLPAPDSLIRASQEPAQAQEGVLLRAASGETHEKNEAQLLRASAGGQKSV